MSLIIETGGDKKPARMVLIGQEKSGKTLTGSQYPKPLFITTEDGCSRIKGLDYFKPAKTWTELLANIDKVGVEDKIEYKTIVIDTVDGVFQLCCDDILERNFSGRQDKYGGWSAGDKAASRQFKQLLERLDRLREKHKTSILLLCHEGRQVVKNPTSEDYEKTIGSMYKDAWGLLRGWVDIIGYLQKYDIHVSVDADGRPIKVKTMSDTRKIIFKGSAGLDSGCRVGYEMPDEVVLPEDPSKNYEAIVNAMKGVA